MEFPFRCLYARAPLFRRARSQPPRRSARHLVACGWFGIQTWIGGQAIYSMLQIVWPAAAQPWVVWVCFGSFWLLNMAVVWKGIETIRFLEGIGAPFMLGVRPAVAVLDHLEGQADSGPCSVHRGEIPHHRRVFSQVLYSVADGDGRVLGNRRIEHPRLHSLCEEPTRSGYRSGAGAADGYDDLFVYRRRRSRPLPPCFSANPSGIRWC